MKKQKILYAITVEDVVNVSNQNSTPLLERDLSFIGDKIGDYLGDKWQDAIEYALNELNKNKQPI